MNALRRQLDHCRVGSRETTGVGFYTHLEHRSGLRAGTSQPGRITLGDVTAEIEGLQRGAGFVLFVEDGVLDLLEGFSYDEPWLNVSGKYEVTAGGISHFAGSETDIETVDAAWDRPGDIAEH